MFSQPDVVCKNFDAASENYFYHFYIRKNIPSPTLTGALF